jgi:SOS-response transcriptional repressor LexA
MTIFSPLYADDLQYRGIKGVFIYACNPELREYLKQHIVTFEKGTTLRMLDSKDVKPYVNAVPLYNISAAAGNFSELQEVEDFEWVELPPRYAAKKDYFVCRVVGESMNKIIPNGSWCLFEKYTGGSRNGKIVLVQHYKIQDSDFGAGYTVKSYHSEKLTTEDAWEHKEILLKPMSDNSSYENIVISTDEESELKVIGIFVGVL